MTHMPRNKRIWQYRLSYMFHAGLINRPPKQRDSPHRSVIYGLANRGAELPAQKDGIDRGLFTDLEHRFICSKPVLQKSEGSPTGMRRRNSKGQIVKL